MDAGTTFPFQPKTSSAAATSSTPAFAPSMLLNGHSADAANPHHDTTTIQPVQEQLQNWAQNLTFSTQTVYYPKTVAEVQQAVRQCTGGVRVIGSRHSINTIADSKHNLISVRDLNKVVSLNKNESTVTVEAGIMYGDLSPFLHQNGYALHNLASLPHITVGGACATATHGSGIHNSNLPSAVSAIEFVTAPHGDVIQLSRAKDGDIFNGVVVNLGALGVVTKLTLDLLPSFDMKQVLYRNLPMSELEKHFVEIMSIGYSVSLFTDWSNKNIKQIWVKRKATDKDLPDTLYGAQKALHRNWHAVETQSADPVTDQMDTPGPWHERLPHFKLNFKPSTGEELQSEFLVPIEHAYEALMKIESIHEQITPHIFASEIRTVKRDNLWMSMCYNCDCVAFHLTWKQEEVVPSLVAKIEQLLAPYSPRPHWAKLFTPMSPSVLESRYEKLGDFKQLMAKYDPEGIFKNEFLIRNLYPN